MMTKIVDCNCFKASLNMLNRLQEFKIPLTKLYEQAICCYTPLDTTADEDCEFYLIGFGGDKEEQIEKYIEGIADIDDELEITTLKLAKLLELKEKEYRDNLMQFTKN